MSLPKELNLGSNKPMATSSRPQVLRFRSDNSSYTAGDTVRIEIPTNRQGHYIFPQESFLEFKYKVNAVGGNGEGTTSFLLDQSAYSFFNRIRVLHGSTVLEDTLYCNKLWTALYDVQVNEAERRQDTITKAVYDTAALEASSIFNSGLYGHIAISRAQNAAAADSGLFEINLVLPSALLGSLCSKCLPISLLGASSIYLELELATLNQIFVRHRTAATANGVLNSYTIQDIYYNAKTAILPMDVEQALISSTGGVVNLPAVAYKCESKAIAATATSFSDKFSFQFSSLKNFLFFPQNQTTANGTIASRSISARPRAYVNEYYLNINGEVFPSQSITGYARQYSELMRAFDMLTDTNAGGILTFSNYTVNLATTATDIMADESVANSIVLTDQKRWVGGIDLDRFNRSSDVLMSGTSTIGQLLSLVVNFSQAPEEALTLYGACMYDVLYHIENGQMVAKF